MTASREPIWPADTASADFDFDQYQAPRGHRQRLIAPRLGSASALIRSNVATSESVPPELANLRLFAREELLRDARHYTAAYRDVDRGVTPQAPIVMAGHQPTLFHPGVWFKNFALDRIAGATGAVAINLVVDSDVAGSSSIRVPNLVNEPYPNQPNATTTSKHISLQSVAYDRRASGMPYEQAFVEDRDLFDRFDQSVTESVRGIVDRPCVTSLWQHARNAIQRCGFAGCAVAQARHALEGELKLQTLEIPQSVICRQESFSAFAIQILRDLPRFHRCYNDATERYRAAHGIRSKAHPVPNLRRQDDWYEAPFWVYGNASPKRQAVWVRRIGDILEIGDFGKRRRTIAAAEHPSAGEALAALASPEFKLRSRALVTTMYARLLTSDLFLHGIGGGKYDQLGDLIAAAFWRLIPPRFMVLSATVLLPGHQQHSLCAVEAEQQRLHANLRNIEFSPEHFAQDHDLDRSLLERKEALLASIPPHGQRAEWHQRITEVNVRLSQQLESVRQQLQQRQTEQEQHRREAAIWNSREHSFCVYPLEQLATAYKEMLDAS